MEQLFTLAGVALGSSGLSAIVVASYIQEGEISLEDKESLTEMYQAYKSLGGNGHLSTIMAEVERLHIVERR